MTTYDPTCLRCRYSRPGDPSSHADHSPRKDHAMSKCPPCWVCGAPAPVSITSRAGTRHACYTHEYDNPTPTKETK